MTTPEPRTSPSTPRSSCAIMNEYDVAVVGVGPAGSVTAEEIAKEGWRTVLLEKSAYPGKNAVTATLV